MATRLYIHAAEYKLPGLPTAEQSVLTSKYGSETDFEADQAMNRTMTTTIGAMQTSISNTSRASNGVVHYYIGRWASPALHQMASVAANTWTLNFAASQSNLAANFPVKDTNKAVYVNVYVWRPTTLTKVGVVRDGTTNLDYDEPSAASTIKSMHGTFSGDAVTGVEDGDVVVFELWAQVQQDTAAAYTQIVYFDGTTVTTSENVTVTSHASFLETPQTLTFATRLYLHAAANTLANLPTVEQSALPVHDAFEANDVANRLMNTVKGSVQRQLSNLSIPDSAQQNYYVGRWVSPPLVGVSAVDSGTWTLNFAAMQSSMDANFPFAVVSGARLRTNVYVWRPLTQAKVGTILDADTNTDYAEPLTAGTIRCMHGTFSGLAVAGVQDGDVIVFEMWSLVSQTGTGRHVQSFYFDGGTVTTTLNMTVSDHASFLETPQSLTFSAPVVGVRLPSIDDFGASPLLSDNTSAIQRAIDTVGAGEIYVPHGRYLFGGQIVIDNKPVVLRGAGGTGAPAISASTLCYAGPATDVPVILFKRTSGVYSGQHQGIESLRITTAQGNAHGVRFDGALIARLSNVEIHAFTATGAYGLDLGSQSVPHDADKCWRVDVSGPSYTDETIDFNDADASDVDPWPTGASEAPGDQFAIGYREPFDQVTLTLGVAGAGGTIDVKYWNGTVWESVVDLVDGTSHLTVSGAITYSIPSNWQKQTISDAVARYYIAIEVATVYATNPTLTQGRIARLYTEALDVTMDHIEINACSRGLHLAGNDVTMVGMRCDQSTETGATLQMCGGAVNWLGGVVQGQHSPSHPGVRISGSSNLKISGVYFEVLQGTAGIRVENGCSQITLEDLHGFVVTRPSVNIDVANSNWITIRSCRHFAGDDTADRAIRINAVNGYSIEADSAAGVYHAYPHAIEITNSVGRIMGGAYLGGDQGAQQISIGRNAKSLAVPGMQLAIDNAPVHPNMLETLRQLGVAGAHTLLCADEGVLNATGVPCMPGEATRYWVCQVSGRVFEQSTSGSRPILAYGVDALANRRAVLFDDTDDYLISTEPASTWAFLHKGAGVTIAVVAVPQANANLDTYLSTLQSTDTRVGLELFRSNFATGSVLTRIGKGTAPYAVSDTSAGSVAPGSPILVLLRHAVALNVPETLQHDADKCWRIDAAPGPSYTDETANFNSAATNDFQFFPASDAVPDQFAIGHGETFSAISLTLSVPGDAGGAIAIKYWNGSAWSLVPSPVDGTSNLTRSGVIKFGLPSDWQMHVLSDGVPRYYAVLEVTTPFSTDPRGTRGRLSPHVNLRINGADDGGPNYAAPLSSADPFSSLVLGNIGSGGAPLNGYIALVGIWNEALSDLAVATLERATAKHYGITLP
jgi:hypothetical protein